MQFKEFLRQLEPPLSYYISYAMKKRGYALEDVEEDKAMELLVKAVGPHVAEVLYSMYLEILQGRKRAEALAIS